MALGCVLAPRAQLRSPRRDDSSGRYRRLRLSPVPPRRDCSGITSTRLQSDRRRNSSFDLLHFSLPSLGVVRLYVALRVWCCSHAAAIWARSRRAPSTPRDPAGDLSRQLRGSVSFLPRRSVARMLLADA